MLDPEHPGSEKPPHFSQVFLENRTGPLEETDSALTSRQLETGEAMRGLESYKQLERAYETQTKAPGLCFFGQLTDTGKRNMMSIGYRLRHLYVDKLKFLDPQLRTKDVYVRSTDYSRTIESVQFLLGGLYPRSTRPAPSSSLSLKNELTIHIRPFEKETMYPHPNCASLLLDTKTLRAQFHQAFLPEAEKAFAKLEHLGLQDANTKNLNAVHRIYDLLACLNGHGLTFPYKVGKDTLQDFEKLAIKQW